MRFFPDDWASIFAIETPVMELLARGTSLYFSILFFLRVLPRRTGGELATMDLVFLLLVAGAAAHSLGDYTTVADSIIVIATLMAWDYLFNVLSFHIPFVERLVSAPSIQVVRNGQLMRRNMRREYLTEEELMQNLRKQGIEDLTEVKAAYIEGEGRITVICQDKGN